MRIGVNCFLLQAHIGGLKQYFLNLFDWLLENDLENEYVLFHFPHNLDELGKLRSPRWKQHAVLLKDQREISPEARDLDVYFCPFGALWPRPVAIPSVVTLVDIQEVFYPEFFSISDLHSRAYHYPSSTRAADRVITISQYSKATIVEHHRIKPEKVIVAYLCADPLYSDAARAQPPDTAVPFNRFMFFPANRWRHKNHDVLLRAMRCLKDAGEAANAVFTGFDVAGGYPLFEKAKEYGVLDCVHTAGYVTVPQMAFLYRHAEMLIFPSLFEGFGMPPVEAMEAGCPTAVANSTCLPEICADAAEYFEPLNVDSVIQAVRRVRDHDRGKTLVEHGYLRAKNFSAEALGLAHLRAFFEAASAYSRGRHRRYKYIHEPLHRLRVTGNLYMRRWLRKESDPSLCRIVFSTGWHSREQDGTNWLRWSDGHGKVVIHAPGELQMRLDGEAASAKASNKLKLLVNGRVEAEWNLIDEFRFFDISRDALGLRSGKNTIELVSSKAGTAVGNGDQRTLAIMVRNLSFTEVRNKIACKLEN